MASKFDYDVFISHARADTEWCKKLAERLQVHRFRVWFDLWEINPGDSYVDRISEGLEKSRRFIAVMTPEYFESVWAELERDSALDAATRTKKKLGGYIIPIKLKAVTPPRLFRHIKSLDFTADPDSEEELQKLVDLLHSDIEKTPAQKTVQTVANHLREVRIESSLRDMPVPSGKSLNNQHTQRDVLVHFANADIEFAEKLAKSVSRVMFSGEKRASVGYTSHATDQELDNAAYFVIVYSLALISVQDSRIAEISESLIRRQNTLVALHKSNGSCSVDWAELPAVDFRLNMNFKKSLGQLIKVVKGEIGIDKLQKLHQLQTKREAIDVFIHCAKRDAGFARSIADSLRKEKTHGNDLRVLLTWSESEDTVLDYYKEIKQVVVVLSPAFLDQEEIDWFREINNEILKRDSGIIIAVREFARVDHGWKEKHAMDLRTDKRFKKGVTQLRRISTGNSERKPPTLRALQRRVTFWKWFRRLGPIAGAIGAILGLTIGFLDWWGVHPPRIPIVKPPLFDFDDYESESWFLWQDTIRRTLSQVTEGINRGEETYIETICEDACTEQGKAAILDMVEYFRLQASERLIGTPVEIGPDEYDVRNLRFFVGGNRELPISATFKVSSGRVDRFDFALDQEGYNHIIQMVQGVPLTRDSTYAKYKVIGFLDRLKTAYNQRERDFFDTLFLKAPVKLERFHSPNPTEECEKPTADRTTENYIRRKMDSYIAVFREVFSLFRPGEVQVGFQSLKLTRMSSPQSIVRYGISFVLVWNGEVRELREHKDHLLFIVEHHIEDPHTVFINLCAWQPADEFRKFQLKPGLFSFDDVE